MSGSRSTRYRAMKRKTELNPSPEMSAASQDDETEVNDDRQCDVTGVTIMKSCQKDDHQEEPLSTYADGNYSKMCETGLQSDELFDGEVDSRFLDAPGMDGSEDETEDEYSDDHSECDQTSPAISSSALLYEGADLTVGASSVLLLQFKMKHKLTQEALGDLLELLKLHCPFPNKCFQSLYLFKKQFCDLKLPVTLHYFCSSCLQTTEDDNQKYQNPSCNKDLSAAGAKSSFIEVSIEAQQQKILHRE